MTRRRPKTEDHLVMDELAVAFQDLCPGWSAIRTRAANSLPVLVLTCPKGNGYRAGKRWGNRDPSRVSVWPSEVDYEATPFGFVAPETSFGLKLGAKGLRRALARLEPKWIPLLEKMEAQQRVNARYEDKRATSLDAIVGALGDSASVLGDQVTSSIAPRVSAKVLIHGGTADLTFYGLPSGLAAECAEWIRTRIGP